MKWLALLIGISLGITNGMMVFDAGKKPPCANARLRNKANAFCTPSKCPADYSAPMLAAGTATATTSS